MLLNNQWITEEIKEEITKYLETNENERTMIQNLWDAANTFLRSYERDMFELTTSHFNYSCFFPSGHFCSSQSSSGCTQMQLRSVSI